MSPRAPPLPHEGVSAPRVSAGASATLQLRESTHGGGQGPGAGGQEAAPGRGAGALSPGSAWLPPGPPRSCLPTFWAPISALEGGHTGPDEKRGQEGQTPQDGPQAGKGRRHKAPGEGLATRTRPSPALAGCVPRGQPGVLCRPPGPRPDLRVQSDERWEWKGLSYSGTELPADHSPEPPRGHCGSQAGLPRDGLGWGPAALWGPPALWGAPLWAPKRTTESPPHPHLPSTVWLWNRGRPRRSEPSVGPTAPARKGGPSWGPDAACPGPAHISGLTSTRSHVRGVGQTPSLPAKPSESHRAGLWGCPSGSNPQRHPSRGQLIR